MALRIRGSHDDGSQDGILRTKLEQGDLVPINLRDRGSLQAAAGTSTLALTNNSGDAAWLGDAGGIIGTIPAAANSQGFKITARAMGRRFAAMLAGQQSGQVGTYDAFVNGVLTYSGDAIVRYMGVPVGVTEAHLLNPIADDLPDDGPHTIDLIFAPDPSIATNITIYDLFGERRFYGALSRRRVGLHQTAITFTNANGLTRQNVPAGGHKNARILRFSNTDTAPVTMILDDGSTDIRSIVVPASTAGASATLPGYIEVDLGDYAAVAGWRLRCDAVPAAGKTVTVRALTGN